MEKTVSIPVIQQFTVTVGGGRRLWKRPADTNPANTEAQGKLRTLLCFNLITILWAWKERAIGAQSHSQSLSFTRLHTSQDAVFSRGSLALPCLLSPSPPEGHHSTCWTCEFDAGPTTCCLHHSQGAMPAQWSIGPLLARCCPEDCSLSTLVCRSRSYRRSCPSLFKP